MKAILDDGIEACRRHWRYSSSPRHELGRIVLDTSHPNTSNFFSFFLKREKKEKRSSHCRAPATKVRFALEILVIAFRKEMTLVAPSTRPKERWVFTRIVHGARDGRPKERWVFTRIIHSAKRRPAARRHQPQPTTTVLLVSHSTVASNDTTAATLENAQ